MKRIKRYAKEYYKEWVTRKNLYNLLFSALVIIACFAILSFRVLYPYHRIIAVSLYLLSWAFIVYPFLRRMNLRKLELNPGLKFIRRHSITITSTAAFLLILYALLVIFPMDSISLAFEDKVALEEKIVQDTEFIQTVIISLDNSYSDLEESGLLELTMESSNPEKAAQLKEHFRIIVDHIITLDQFIEEYKYFYQINYLKYPGLNQEAFLISYSAYMAKYKAVLELSEAVDDNAYVEVLLNEQVPDLGTSNVYHSLKSRINHPNTLIRLNTGRAYLEYIGMKDGISDGASVLVSYSKGTYAEIFGSFDSSLKVGLDTIFDSFEKNTMERWMPVQKTVANALGETKLTTRHDYFITDEQIQEIYPLIEPGDIMFQRRNWYVSNTGMPGFWTHAAIYMGTSEQMDEYFDEESKELFNMSVSQYLKVNYPQLYADKQELYDGKYQYTTIEGKAPGVIMLPMEVSAKADYLAFIRPKLSKMDKLKALKYTFDNYLKPYDYDFDFSSDDALVCSELVYKAYLPTSDKAGLVYRPEQIAGRWLVTPHDMVRTFDENYDTENEQNEFIFFLDGNEAKGIAEFKDADEFRQTWKRPKYDLLLD